MKVKILITGGTVDNLEYSSENEAPLNHKSLIPSLLDNVNLNVVYDCQILMQKDSKFITNDDRKKIEREAQNCDEKNIVITHGTMTMSETARYLGQRNIPKTVILTGASIPANRPNSDALFNLGGAVIASQVLPIGVYICMNGKIFNWDNVKKNMETGYFETV